jgi:hypothetical protein
MVKYNKYSTKYNCLIKGRTASFQIWFPNNLGLLFTCNPYYNTKFPVCHALNFNEVSSAYLNYFDNKYAYGTDKKSWEKYMERVRRVMDEAEL